MNFNNLPTEILLHIFKYLNPSDRLVCRLVSKRCYEAHSDFHHKVHAVINAHKAFPILKNALKPIINIELKDLELKTEDLNLWQAIGPNVVKLEINKCSIFEKTFLQLLSCCKNLQELIIKDTDSIFISGSLLQHQEDITEFKKSMCNLRSLSIKESRYLSDVIFIRIVSSLSNLQQLSLSGCCICYSRAIYRRFYPQTSNAIQYSTSLLSLPIIQEAISLMSASLTSLDLSKTDILNEALNTLLKIENLKLQELNLSKCSSIDSRSLNNISFDQPNLKYLSMQLNKNMDFISSSITFSINLDLSSNLYFSVTDFEAIAKLRTLRSLNLSECPQITSEEFKLALCQHPFPHLEQLHLCYTSINDETLSKIVQCIPTISTLDLTGCRNITNGGVVCINKYCRNLKTLKLRCCRCVTLNVKDIFSNLKKLQVLDLCSISFETQTLSLGSMLKFPNLNYLDVTGCNALCNADLTQISQNNTSLEVLILSMCPKITDDGIKSLKNVPRLRQLSLQGCSRIGNSSLKVIESCCPQLRLLEIAHCPLINLGAVELLELSSPILIQIKS